MENRNGSPAGPPPSFHKRYKPVRSNARIRRKLHGVMSSFQPVFDAEKIREQFPATSEVRYLNTGTYGLMPERALQRLLEAVCALERRGVACTFDYHGAESRVRERIARLWNSEPSEVAFSRNATDGTNFVLSGLEWSPGDEILSTDEEHPSLQHPLLYLQKTKGVKVTFLPISTSADEMLDRLDRSKTARTKMVAMSHVPCETGTRLPVKQICDWARENGILSLIDGAQSFGAMPIDLKDIGCDFFSSNGHKWMCGPKGTGLMYARIERMIQLKPAHIGAGSLEKADPSTGAAETWASGMKFEFGSRAYPLIAGLEASLEWLEELGFGNIFTHIQRLSDYAKERLTEIDSCEMLTPLPYSASSGLVSFRFKGHDSTDLANRLREKYKIHTRMILGNTGFRIATAHYITDEDIDFFVDRVGKEIA